MKIEVCLKVTNAKTIVQTIANLRGNRGATPFVTKRIAN